MDNHDIKGTHIFVELKECQYMPKDKKDLKTIIKKSLLVGNLNACYTKIYPFKPQGYTVFVILKESSLSLHIWEEHNFITIDLHTCGENCFPEKTVEYLVNVFKSDNIMEYKHSVGVKK